MRLFGITALLAAGLAGAGYASGNNSSVATLTTASNQVAFAQAISHNGQNVTGAYDTGTFTQQTGEVFRAFRLVSGKAVPITMPGADDSTLGSFGEGVNDAGDVVGEFNIPGSQLPHAFLSHGTQTTDLNTVLGATFSQARDINNAGTIVGFALWPDDTAGGFILTPGGAVIHIPNAQVTRVNSAGHVVGMIIDPGTGAAQPFFYAGSNTDASYDPNALHILGTLGGSDDIRSGDGPQDINDSDKIVGGLIPQNSSTVHAVVWANGTAGATPTDLFQPATQTSIVYGVNNAGHMVGLVNGGPFYTANGSLQDQNLVNLNRIVSEGKSPSFQVYSVRRISDNDHLTAEAAPNQVPPPVGVLISLSGGSTPPPATVTLTGVSVSSAQVTTPSPISVVLTFSGKIPTTGVSVDVTFASSSSLGTLTQSYAINHSSGKPNQAVVTFSGFSHVTASTQVQVSATDGTATVNGPSVTIGPAPPKLTAVTAEGDGHATTLTVGDLIHVTATFSSPVPASGLGVTVSGLSSGENLTIFPDAQVPTTAKFDLHTSEVIPPSNGKGFKVKISVKSGTITKSSGQLTIIGPVVLKLDSAKFPKTVEAPNSIPVDLQFTGNLPSGGVSVDVTVGSNPKVQVPVANVSGSKASLTIPTTQITTAQTLHITVAYGGGTESADVKVTVAPTPLKVVSLALLDSSNQPVHDLNQGDVVNAQITFNQPVTKKTTVDLKVFDSSNHLLATVPLKITKGFPNTTFSVPASALGAVTGSYTVVASFNGSEAPGYSISIHEAPH